MKHLKLLALTLSLLILVQVPAYAETVRILMAGNSYTFYNNMPQTLENLLNMNSNGQTTYEVKKLTRGGAKLVHFAKDKSVMNYIANNIDAGTPFDIVIFQEQSTAIFYTEDRLASLSAFNYFGDEMKKFGFKGYVVSTWPRRADSDFYRQPNYSNLTNMKTPAEMGDALITYYDEIQSRYGLKHIPLVRYWMKGLKNDDLNLYNSDGSHPSNIGSYLYAMAAYEAITGRRPGYNLQTPNDLTQSQKNDLIALFN